MVDARRFRSALGRFATGVTVVTATGARGPVGMTANAVCSLSLDPLLVLVCFDNQARTLEVVRDTGRFGVNVLAAGQEDLARLFASKRPENEKFDGIGWSERSGVPALDGCLAGIACEVRELVPGGDHLIAIGEVVDLWSAGGEPLVFYRGDYWALGEREDAPEEVDEALEGPSAP